MSCLRGRACPCAGSELTTVEGLRALQAQAAASGIGVPEQEALEAAVQVLEDFQARCAASSGRPCLGMHVHARWAGWDRTWC